ncbi:MAG: hypothetical protein AB8B79_15070 [Granulosicoccus sp.]
MSRRLMHGIFIAATICLLIAALLQWIAINKTQAINNALDSIPSQLGSRDEYVIPESASNSASVELAVANALSSGNNLEQAELVFNDLIRKHEFDELGQAAQFNLANAYLRQGIKLANASTQSMSMLELAKQRYRDLLRGDPTHWNARYNLERALLLAPETTDTALDEKNEPIKRVRVIVPGFEKQDLP